MGGRLDTARHGVVSATIPKDLGAKPAALEWHHLQPDSAARAQARGFFLWLSDRQAGAIELVQNAVLFQRFVRSNAHVTIDARTPQHVVAATTLPLLVAVFVDNHHFAVLLWGEIRFAARISIRRARAPCQASGEA